MNKLLSIALLSSVLLFASPTFASGTTTCTTQYGGTQTCVTTGQLQVNKEVFDPISGKFVDNLGTNNHLFGPGEVATFKITVKNIGDTNLSKVSVSDLPQSEFLSLAAGSLNFDLNNLQPGESRSQEVKLKVADGSKMPQNNVICVINTAEARADNSFDKDNAQLCIERKVAVPVTQALPTTGAEDWILGLISGVSSLAGLRFMKFGKYSSKAEAMSNHEEVEDRFIRKGRG